MCNWKKNINEINLFEIIFRLDINKTETSIPLYISHTSQYVQKYILIICMV